MLIKAMRGKEIRCGSWRVEALLRMLENTLENAENPDDLIVYASLAKAARNWDSYNSIVKSLINLKESETLLIQSGKPIGIINTHKYAPIVLMANCNLVGKWATSENFYELEKKGLIAWGGLTAADWQYIGSQGVIQGTYEIYASIARKYFGGTNSGRFILTSGLGGMSGAQPLAGIMTGACILVVEVDENKIDKRIEKGYLRIKTHSLNEALSLILDAKKNKKPLSVGLVGNAAEVYQEILSRKIIPDIVSDQTSAHDLLYGYIPEGYSLKMAELVRKDNPDLIIKDAGESIAKEVSAMLEFKALGAVVFDNGNNIRTQAYNYGVKNSFEIEVFSEAYLRPLFARGIGPFRWVALSGNKEDIEKIDACILEEFRDNPVISNWIEIAGKYIPVEGLPARIGWLGHRERSKLALKVNEMVKKGELDAPVVFTRDHLDGAAMAHPNIMTENLKDGSDTISDWVYLNAMLNCSSMADLVAIHSGGGGYSGYMTSAGVTITADGSDDAALRLKQTLDNETSLGVLRYADAGYSEALEEVKSGKINRIKL